MLNVKYIEAEPWLGVSEEEVVTATAQIEEENRRSDLLSGSRSSNLDDDLTSLSWLMDFSVSSRHHIDAPKCSSAEDLEPPDMLQNLSKPAYRRSWPENQCPDEVDYKTNPAVKPPYSYANMIYMAMQASNKPKITLSCIYKWITDNFCYYRYAEPTWQNSIRHNLSLNKCFVKVPRQQNEPGKGGFWAIDPQHAERLLSGAYKNRHMPPVRINPAFTNHPKNRVQAEPTFVATVKPKTSQMLKNKLMDINQDSCFAATTWVSEDTENPFGHSNDNLPLCVIDENEDQSVSNGPSELDPLLTSAWNEDPSLDYGRPLSPVPQDEDLMAHRNHFSGQEVLSNTGEHQELLESHSCSEGDMDDPFIESVLHNTWSDVCEMSCLDLLTSSTDNTEQLFDFEIKIESLL